MHRRPTSLLVGVALLAALSACSSATPVPSPSSMDNSTATEAVSRCLADKGWDIVDAAGGEANVPPEQLSVYTEDLEACSQQVVGKVDTSPLSDDELTKLYAVEAGVAECLADLGYQTDMPSLQVFIDSYHSGAPFTAYADLTGLTEAQWNAANDQCPQAALVFKR